MTETDLLGDPVDALAELDLPDEDLWSERLGDLLAYSADEIHRALPEIDAGDVRRVAYRVTARLCREIGGSRYYWPKSDEIERALRNLAIWSAHDGTANGPRGVRALARQYKLSDNQVWNILREQRRRHQRRHQLELLGWPEDRRRRRA